MVNPIQLIVKITLKNVLIFQFFQTSVTISFKNIKYQEHMRYLDYVYVLDIIMLSHLLHQKNNNALYSF